MEALHTKLRHLTAASKAESVFPFVPIEYTARKLFAKGKLAVELITSKLVSKFGTPQPQDLINPSFCSGDTASIGQNRELYLLANNPKTSSTILGYMSTSCTIPILESVAMNENTSRATLRHLADHVNPLVRTAVTENRYAPFEILSLLSEDEHPDVRFAMAENPDVPKPLLIKLAADENPYVACCASTTLKRMEEDGGSATVNH